VLGWTVSIYRQVDTPRAPATWESRQGEMLARWDGEIGALDWLRQLEASEEAICLGGDGYPVRYSVVAEAARTALVDGLPQVRRYCTPFVDSDALDGCDPEEWLVVEAWDLS
jgi:hypothetical protein